MQSVPRIYKPQHQLVSEAVLLHNATLSDRSTTQLCMLSYLQAPFHKLNKSVSIHLQRGNLNNTPFSRELLVFIGNNDQDYDYIKN